MAKAIHIDDPRARRGTLGELLRTGAAACASRTGSIFRTFTLVYLRNAEADFEVELTINKGQTEPYELGTGYGHVAFVVDDLDAEHARFETLGFKPRNIVDFKSDGVLLARFFFVDDPDGYKIEVLQRHGRYR